jgi:hypothetical protein
MTTRQFLRGVVCIGIGVAALALGVTERLIELPAGVTEANLRRIRKGMTLVEVEAILGGPARKQRSWKDLDSGERYSTSYWPGRGWDACVRFGENGRVHHASFWFGNRDEGAVEEQGIFDGFVGQGVVVVEEPRILDRLRSLLGWLPTARQTP